MKDKKTIVIFYSKGLYDTTAMQLADALSADKNCHVIAIGDDKYTNFGKGKFVRRTYIFSTRNARWMYGIYSNMTVKKKAPNKALKNIKADPVERTGVNKFLYDMTCRYHKVKNILRRYEPDLVLCFTPGVLNCAIKANEQLRMYTTKIYACVTDFAFDMRFFNRRCAGYIVQNKDVERNIVNIGIDESKIYMTSIITRDLPKYDKNEIKKEIGIRNDKPCLLLVGGRYGANSIKNAIVNLLNYTDHFNIVVLTGGSKTIVNVAKQLVHDDNSVFVIDKIDDISKVYNVADIFVCTPTTCICSEILTYDKPLVLLKGVGQVEKNNAKYLLTHNLATDGSNKEKLIVALSDILIEKDDEVIEEVAKANIGSMNDLTTFLLGKAEETFEEKKILTAERESMDKLEEESKLIEEVDMDEELPDNVTFKSVKGNNDNISDNDALIDEYND